MIVLNQKSLAMEIVYDIRNIMASPKTAQVIGGGIVGLNVALALQERGIAVVLINPESWSASPSWGNAGHIATEQVEPLASWRTIRSLPSRLFLRGGAAAFPPHAISAWLPFGLRLVGAASPARYARGKTALGSLLAEALPAWRRRVSALGQPELLREQGHLVVWESDATAKAGRANWARADTGTVRWRDLNPDEGRDLQSRIGTPIAGAIRFEGSASVSHPEDVLSALRAQFKRAGGTLEHYTATPQQLARAEITVLCAGVASGQYMRQLGHRVPIIAERGYHIQSKERKWGKGLPPLVFEDRSVVITQFKTALRATSFVEFAHQHTTADPRKWQRLRKHTLELDLPFDERASQWIGARPTLPDYLPAIGRSDRVPSLYYAFGHQHLGLTTAPITGELMAALVCGDAPPVNLAPFSLSRFERRWI